MIESILTSIKKLIGIAEEYEYFDADLIIHINSVFMILRQLGVGPDDGFFIEDSSAIWSDYTDDEVLYNAVKSYMAFKVRMMFDPPQSSAVTEAINKEISELEWRLLMVAEIGV